MYRFLINKENPLPPHVQLKEQIRLAWTVGQLRPGDVLPSVRDLAKELGIGEALVRRAYKELVALGILASQQRKRVVVSPSLSKRADSAQLFQESLEEAARILQWTRKARVNSVSFARLLMRRALEQEADSPFHLYVDASEKEASRFAEQISQAWGTRVMSASLEQVRGWEKSEWNRFRSILANSFYYEQIVRLLGSKKKVLPLSVRYAENFVRKLRSLPPSSNVLLVLSHEDFAPAADSIIQYLKVLSEDSLRFRGVSFGQVDLESREIQKEYALIVVTSHMWDAVPEKIKRLQTVVPSQRELDMHALEEIRLSAGVLV